MGETMNRREAGRMKWFNEARGYGFITADDGKDVFVHWKAICYQGGNQRRKLPIGARVNFSIVQTEKGLEARAVTVARE